MNIMENKRVALIALVMALAFGGICYYGYDRYTALQSYKAQIAETSSTLENYASETNPPNAKNRDLISQAAEKAKELRDSLYNDLLQYASFCMAGQGAQVAVSGAQQSASPAPTGDNAYKPVTNPNAFQHNFGALSASLADYAKDKCSFAAGEGASPAKFGNFSLYEKDAAKEEDVPYLNFLIYAADDVMRHIIDSGAPAIKKIYFRELPEAAERKDKIVRLSFEVMFTAKRSDLIAPANATSQSVLPQVLNKIPHDKRFFFIPTGVAVKTSDSLPDNDRLAFDAIANAIDDDDDSEEQQPATVAIPLTGKPDETVDVYLTLQVLYFTTDKF